MICNAFLSFHASNAFGMFYAYYTPENIIEIFLTPHGKEYRNV